MVCYTATLQGCPGNDPLQFVYGVAPPASGTQALGTVVFFAGDGGDHAADGPDQTAMLASYIAAGFQVVQIAWGPGMNMQDGQDWELTNVTQGHNPASILVAACRPATFLNWVRNSNSGVGQGIWKTYHGGMCAHGHSAGSGALGYALSWYNAGAPPPAANGSGYLDHAVFTAGPVFSDISQGCQVPNNLYTYICENSNQKGCKGWSAQDPPGFFLEYATGYKSSVNLWSGNTAPIACANNSQATSPSQNSSWLQMSILYNQGTQQPSFTYSATGLSAWECETVQSGYQINNATAQGQLYWAEFTNSSQFNSLSVNAVTACSSSEGVYNGTVAASGKLGSADILDDMVANCKSRH
jgi:hypothetical protein